MVFIETSVFSRLVADLLSDDEYSEFQQVLAENPRAGDVVPDTGGLRKVRVAAKGKGKRGGARVIYYHVSAEFQIRLLLIYAKGIQEDLTPEQKRILRKLNEGW
jgi:hypothetical protein